MTQREIESLIIQHVREQLRPSLARLEEEMNVLVNLGFDELTINFRLVDWTDIEVVPRTMVDETA